MIVPVGPDSTIMPVIPVVAALIAVVTLPTLIDTRCRCRGAYVQPRSDWFVVANCYVTVTFLPGWMVDLQLPVDFVDCYVVVLRCCYTPRPLLHCGCTVAPVLPHLERCGHTVGISTRADLLVDYLYPLHDSVAC